MKYDIYRQAGPDEPTYAGSVSVSHSFDNTAFDATDVFERKIILQLLEQGETEDEDFRLERVV